MLLAHNLAEGLRSPFPGDNLVAHRLRLFRDCRAAPRHAFYSGLETHWRDKLALTARLPLQHELYAAIARVTRKDEELRVLRGTRNFPVTVAPFRAWRGWRGLVAQS